jgi:hypothetical protein
MKFFRECFREFVLNYRQIEDFMNCSRDNKDSIGNYRSFKYFNKSYRSFKDFRESYRRSKDFVRNVKEPSTLQ